MSLYKRPTSRFWWFKIRTPDRKCIQKSTNTDDREKAAMVEQAVIKAYGKNTPISKMHAMIDMIYGADASGLPLAEIWPTYCQWREATNKTTGETTLRKRRNAIERFIDWARKNWPNATTAESVDRQVAVAFAASLAAEGTKGKTRKNIIGDLSTLWESLRRVRDDLKNPWPLVRPDAHDSERGKPFTREQEKAVLAEAAKGDAHWHLASLIARYTGLRYSSVARLTWKEIDFEAGVIRHTPPKTARHKIEVLLPIAAKLRPALEKAWADRPAPAPRTEAKGKPKRRMLDASNVLPLHAAYYPDPEQKGGPGAFAPVLTAAKIGPGYTFHSWRHTFRTRLSEAGVSDDLAKRLGGWTEDATAARYDHAERVTEMLAAVDSAS
jgi:integrase